MRVENQNRTPKSKRRLPFIVSYAVVLMLVFLLNAYIFPAILQSQVTEIDYGSFLDKLEAGELKKVQLNDNSIYFTDNNDTVYMTNSITQDYEIVNRLRTSGVKFDRVYQQRSLLQMIFLTDNLIDDPFACKTDRTMTGNQQAKGLYPFACFALLCMEDMNLIT